MEKPSGELPPPPNPLALRTAMTLAVLFQIGLYLVTYISNRFGSAGTLVSAALLGLMDVDALIFTMLQIGGEATRTPLAALAIAVGVLSNTVLKAGLAIAIGKGAFRRIASIGLGLLLLASIAGILVVVLLY